MIKNVFIAILGSLLVSVSAQARLERMPEEQGNSYITHLSQLGKDQINYKEFKTVLESLQKEGYVMDSSRLQFYFENVQQMPKGQNVRNWFEFAIEVNFSGKVVVRDGVKYLRTPMLRALGLAQEICDKSLVNCEPADVVDFTSYELGWREIPALGGGTSSAGDR